MQVDRAHTYTYTRVHPSPRLPSSFLGISLTSCHAALANRRYVCSTPLWELVQPRYRPDIPLSPRLPTTAGWHTWETRVATPTNRAHSARRYPCVHPITFDFFSSKEKDAGYRFFDRWDERSNYRRGKWQERLLFYLNAFRFASSNPSIFAI